MLTARISRCNKSPPSFNQQRRRRQEMRETDAFLCTAAVQVTGVMGAPPSIAAQPCQAAKISYRMQSSCLHFLTSRGAPCVRALALTCPNIRRLPRWHVFRDLEIYFLFLSAGELKHEG